jgi:aspartate dehydrogenase
LDNFEGYCGDGDAKEARVNTVLLVGFGAMGRFVYENLKDHPLVERWVVMERAEQRDAVQSALKAGDLVVSSYDELPAKPSFAVECAGHDAVRRLVPQLLNGGICTIVASVGALANLEIATALDAACETGGSQLTLVPGALAGVDALAAAKLFGLDSVRYSGRKPPRSWAGTRAETLCDLASLTAPCTFFRGTAREAATTFPQNANVAAMVGLAGLGLDSTTVELIADPAATGNTHTIAAEGNFGSMEIRIAAKAFPANPKTSALAGMSVIRTVQNRLNHFII